MRHLKGKFLDGLWQVEPSELTRCKRVLHAGMRIAVMVGQDFIENLMKLQAMALAFKTLLSIAPLTAVVFSILKAVGVHNRIEPVLNQALAPLGEKGDEVTAHLIGFVDKMSAGALGSIGLIALFVTVLSLMGTIEQALNLIWRVKAPRRLARRFSDYLSVLVVGPVLVFAALTITATLQSNTFVRSLLALEPFGTILLTLLRLVPYVTLWAAFTFFYLFIPNTRVKLRSAMIGGVVAAVLWQTVGWGFATFVASSTRYDAIYSSFAILLLFLLWLYVGWVIVLLGAQVSHAQQNIRFYSARREDMARSPAGREKLALQVLRSVGRNFHNGVTMSVAELAAPLRLPVGIVNDFMRIFHQARLVVAQGQEETFVLARAPERITIKEILDCVRNYSGNSNVSRVYLPERDDDIDELLLAVDRSVAAILDGRTLQTLIADPCDRRLAGSCAGGCSEQ